MLLQSEHYLVAYGSLLSSQSRREHSGIHAAAVPVTVRGWRRAWVTRSVDERQTYVGALDDTQGEFNAALIPVSLDPSLQERESDYQFVSVTREQLDLHIDSKHHNQVEGHIERAKVWICQSKGNLLAEADFPIYQSYVDTCLSGCIESNIDDFTTRFIHSTDHWDTHLIDDRTSPRYPRAATLKPEYINQIDGLLKHYGVFHHGESKSE